MQSAIQQFAERLEMETTIGIYIFLYIFNIYRYICCFFSHFQAADSRRRQIADGIDNLEEEAIYGSDL